MSQGDRRSAKVWRRGMKSNDERIKTLEKFNIIGRKKRPVAAVLLLLLTAAVFLSLSIAMFKGVDTVRCPYCGAEYYLTPDRSHLHCKKCGKDSCRG